MRRLLTSIGMDALLSTVSLGVVGYCPHRGASVAGIYGGGVGELQRMTAKTELKECFGDSRMTVTGLSTTSTNPACTWLMVTGHH